MICHGHRGSSPAERRVLHRKRREHAFFLVLLALAVLQNGTCYKERSERAFFLVPLASAALLNGTCYSGVRAFFRVA